MTAVEFILASGSPYRQELLKSTGIVFRCATSGVDESEIVCASPRDTALSRAMAKAEAVGKKYPNSIVLGCDQILDFAGKSLVKATTAAEVREHLKLLSGRKHVLQSAYCLYFAGYENSPYLYKDVVAAEMYMRVLSDEEKDSLLTMNGQKQWAVTVTKE